VTFERPHDRDGYWAGQDFVYQDGDHVQALKLDIWMAPRTHLPSLHAHPKQIEYFQVVSGCFEVKIKRKLRTLEAGESITIDPGTYHAVGNASDNAAIVYAEITPGLRTQSFFNELRKLENRKANAAVIIMHYGKLLRRYQDEYQYLPLTRLILRGSVFFAQMFPLKEAAEATDTRG
jgi:mannose-6-phosphate isomerase-like protein (cupin superfamily)